MYQKWMNNRKGKLCLGHRLLPRALALAVLAAGATAASGASSGAEKKAVEPAQLSIFDPFALSSATVILGQSDASGSADSKEIRLSADTIHISSRPELRSPFRPPFTPPGPPVGTPGRPPFAPPGKPQK